MNNTPKKTEDYGRNKNGRFIKGNQGKPKGATNKTSKDLRKFITSFLNDKTSDLFEIWDSLDNKDKASLFLHLSKLVIPRNEVNEDEQKNVRLLNIDPLNDPRNKITVEIIPPESTLTREQAIEYSKYLDEMY